MPTGVPAHKENEPGRKGELSYKSGCTLMTSPSQSQGLGEVISNELFISCIFLCTEFLQDQAKEAYAVSADQTKSSGGGFGVGKRRLVIRGPDVLISAEQFRLTRAQQVQMRRWHLVLEAMVHKCARCIYGKILLPGVRGNFYLHINKQLKFEFYIISFSLVTLRFFTEGIKTMRVSQNLSDLYNNLQSHAPCRR